MALRTIPKAELVSALAYLTMPALIGPVVGPPLGGFIATYFSWRWIFWINIPVGVLGSALAALHREHQGARRRAFRLQGISCSPASDC